MCNTGAAMGLAQHHETGGALAVDITPPAELSSRQKAALIVRLLLSQDVFPDLDRLSAGQQADLTRAMGTLGPISRATLAAVVHEFTSKLDALGIAAPHDLPGALALMEPHISETARDGLRAEAEAGDSSDPWTRLSVMAPTRLKPLLQRESAEVCAILLSKLSVAKAASLLSELSPERAQVIAHSVALTATVTPEMVTQIGEHLLRQVRAEPLAAFETDPVNRVGAILNAVKAGIRDDVLDGLTERDEEFGNNVRRAIFTFKHIPKRVEPGDVPTILRQVQPNLITMALAAGMKDAPLTVEFMLENMSKRLAEQMRDEAETLNPREADGEAAMAAVVAAIRDLEEQGEIQLIPVE